jgi:hypothetical protein
MSLENIYVKLMHKKIKVQVLSFVRLWLGLSPRLSRLHRKLGISFQWVFKMLIQTDTVFDDIVTC